MSSVASTPAPRAPLATSFFIISADSWSMAGGPGTMSVSSTSG
jgi:hypothetical protein